jgi:hypothetical protein
MKPLAKSLGLKEFLKCLKTMLNELPIDKWGMGKKANLNESKESSTFMFSTSSNKGNLNSKNVRFGENVNLHFV